MAAAAGTPRWGIPLKAMPSRCSASTCSAASKAPQDSPGAASGLEPPPDGNDAAWGSGTSGMPRNPYSAERGERVSVAPCHPAEYEGQHPKPDPRHRSGNSPGGGRGRPPPTPPEHQYTRVEHAGYVRNLAVLTERSERFGKRDP